MFSQIIPFKQTQTVPLTFSKLFQLTFAHCRRLFYAFFSLLRMRAIFSKIKLHIVSFGMAPFDAYRAMDTNRDGRLCSSEL